MFKIIPSVATVGFDSASDAVSASIGTLKSCAILVLPVPDIPDNITNRESFIIETEQYVKEYMVEDRNLPGVKLAFKEGKQIDINNKPGYQAISTDEGKAVMVATFVLQSNRITVASLLYPAESGKPAIEQIPWRCYKKFVESVRETR